MGDVLPGEGSESRIWLSGHRAIGKVNKYRNLRLGGYLVAAALATGWLPAQAADAAGKPAATLVKKAKAKPKQKKPPELAANPAPPAPLRPYQLPAQAPKVTFQNGQLAIVADNAMLGAILEQVRAATGAAVEAGPSVGGERVSVRLGPGAPREVMAELLNGSNYNYVLLGSLRDPQALERVIVTQRGAGAPSTSAAPAPARTFPVTVRQTPQPPPDEEAEVEPETEESGPEVQPQVPAETVPPSPQANPQTGPPPGTPGQPPQVKTPQELLQELQERMQRQQQEKNEQQRQQQEEEPR